MEQILVSSFKVQIKDNMKSEMQLIQLAEMQNDDSIANSAMKELKQRYASDYKWCQDCDGRVVKEKECCLNTISKEENSDLKVDLDW